MSPRARFWGIVALMCVALALCVYITVDRIQSDLLTRAQAALAGAGVPFYGVGVDGRDILLHGFVSSEQEAARVRTIVAGIHGVRQVHDGLVVERVAEPPTSGSAATARLDPARLRVQRLGPRLFIGGALPDDGSSERLLRAARERFGAGNVTDSIAVRDAIGHPRWLDAPDRLIELLGSVSDNVRLVIEGGTGILSGEIARSGDLDRVRDLAASIPGIEWRLELFSRRGPLSDGGGGR